MAIHTLDVTGRVDDVFGRVMDTAGGEDGMGTGLVKLRLDVFGGNVAAVARVAVLFFVGEVE